MDRTISGTWEADLNAGGEYGGEHGRHVFLSFRYCPQTRFGRVVVLLGGKRGDLVMGVFCLFVFIEQPHLFIYFFITAFLLIFFD